MRQNFEHYFPLDFSGNIEIFHNGQIVAVLNEPALPSTGQNWVEELLAIGNLADVTEEIDYDQLKLERLVAKHGPIN